MSIINTNEFKQLLEDERKKLEDTLSQFGKRDPRHAENWEPRFPDLNPKEGDAEEGADETEQFDANVGIEARLEEKLREITRSLERIEQGTYGICEKDGKEIDPERLRAYPAARTCRDHP
ncbi:MAG: TraR/DksA C4-type zinc finger protein [Patescibacteria group bacterium]